MAPDNLESLQRIFWRQPLALTEWPGWLQTGGLDVPVLPSALLDLVVLSSGGAQNSSTRAASQAGSARDGILDMLEVFLFNQEPQDNPVIISIIQPGQCWGNFYWE